MSHPFGVFQHSVEDVREKFGLRIVAVAVACGTITIVGASVTTVIVIVTVIAIVINVDDNGVIGILTDIVVVINNIGIGTGTADSGGDDTSVASRNFGA